MDERYVLQVYVGSLSRLYEALSIEASKTTTADEIVECICEKLTLNDGAGFYELAEVMGNQGGQDCKERRIGHHECPVALQLLWPKKSSDKNTGGHTDFKFCLRRKLMGNLWSLSMADSNDSQLIRDYFLRFLYQPRNCEYPDLCQLPDLTEQTLLENLKARFEKGHIYTYVGSILIAVNPFTFYPIYNPKYVQLYQNRRLGDLPPHIFAIADAAYQSMLRKRKNQCIVISGESGSGKTESTNLLLHHLTALSQKGTHGSGVEQTILGAGPVLEAFGNAKTKFNNNSSRFGKFIQVNYKENGAVHGALVQKYLLEKSRIVSQVKNERNYHVFYYLLDGLSNEEKDKLYLTKPSDYFYLNQSKCYTLEGVDERHEFTRLTQSMEMVGFSKQKQFLCFQVLSAVLHLGNVQFSKKSTYHSDETVMVKNPEEVTIISKLLNVKEETLTTALTCKRTKAAKGEMLVINYKLPDAIATRDAMAKCLYGALFDWIVMQVNHALLSKKDPREHKGNSIGVLDIFGFEDFGDHNNFEQFCINYANERLQYYFNQHVFKYEQEEYQREGISWRNIDFNDNTECLKLIEDKPDGLLYLLDDQCNFPCGSNETVLQKFTYHHNSNYLFEVPPCRGSAFTIKHYAGKVKYQIRDFREKNLDLMRPDIVSVLKVSQMAFVRELVCSDPLALFRWQILKAFFKAYFIFSKLRELSKVKRGLTDAYLIKEFSTTNRRRPSGNMSIGGSVNCSSLQLRKKKYSSPYHLSRKAGFEKSIRNFKLLKQLLGPPSSASVNSPTSTSYTILSPSLSLSSSLNNTSTILLQSSSSSSILSSSSTSSVNLGGNKHAMPIPRAARKQTPTVTHQFQQSLQQLMDTLSHANPFFVRCIKSNADKMPNHFDDRLVLMQLRYTGMLETVRIRQSGYSVRLTFDEFIQHYRILLPKGLLSSKMDVQQFLLSMKLQPDMYQIGKTKVFMRESEKLVLDERLHEEILRRIINLQRWVRTWLCRKRFSEMRNAAIVIQTYARRYIAQRRLSQLKKIAQYENWAANCIQKHWRCYQMRQWFTNLRRSVVNFQSHCRGYLLRTKLDDISEQNAKARDEIKQQQQQQQQQQTKSNVSVSIRSMPPAQPSSVSQRGSDDPEILIPEPVQFAQDFIANAFSNISSTTTPTSTTTAETVKTQSGTGRLCTTTITIHNSTVTNDDHDLEEDANPLESDLDDDDHFENDDHIHLNRKRNIPIRKTSFKRKANNKSLSDDKLLTTIANQHDQSSTGYGNSSSTNLHQTNQQQQHQSSSHGHRQLSKLASDTNVMLTSTSSLSAFGSSGYNTNSDSASSFQKLRIYDQVSNTDLGQQSSQQFQQQQQLRQPIHNRLQGKFSSSDQDQGTATSSSNVGAIQKAKATFKNMIGKSSSQEISKRSLKQSVSVKGSTEMDSEMYQQLQQQQQQQASQYSNQHFVPNKSLSNSDLGLPNVGSIESGSFNFYLYNNQQPQSINNNTSSHHDNQSHFSSYTSTSSTQKPRTLSQEGNFSLLSRHFIKKEEHFKSGEICAICENSMLSMAYQQQPQSHYKCSECRQLFHNKCIHLSSDIPCKGSSTSAPSGNSVLSALNPSRPPRNKQKKQKNFSKSYIPKENQESCSLLSHNIITHHNDSLSIDDQSNNSINSSTTKQSVRITQFTDPHDILITDKDELQIMDKFISKKIREIEEVKKKSKESMVDVVFKIALKEFKSNLYSTYSVANQEGYFTRLTYKDLIVHFEQILLNVCQKEKTYTSFPVIMGVNAFRGFMDELRKTHNRNELKAREDKMNGYNSKKSYKRKQSKKIRSRKKEDEVFTSYEHEFILSMANIYTVCEVCSSFMWLMDKIWVCRRCKLTCHKKCAEKVNHTCRDNSKSPNKLIFGSPLTKLISDECRIPWVVEQLITKIELKGLYTEGIYRKSGTSSKINELKQRFDEEIPDLDLDQYSIHVLAATLKLFFREMPEPLMTYELYDDFLWATTISDPTERVQIILNHISKLPRANYDLLERLTFHLARVAQQESANRMNANSLAIVFAPCVLRTNKMMQMQDKLNDISKQTICIESIISERMRQISDTLNDIDILDVACHTASSRLSSIRYSKLNPSRDSAGLIRTNSNVDDEEALLTQRINELITEKNHLTTILPTFRLASACSDEDMLSSNENDEQINANVGSSAEDGIAGGTVYRSSKTLTNRILVEHHNQSTPQASTSKNVVTSGSMKPRVTTQQKALHSTMADHSETLNLNDESMLQHPTKNRAHTPQRRRPPSRFGGGGGGVDPKSFTGRSIHTDKD